MTKTPLSGWRTRYPIGTTRHRWRYYKGREGKSPVREFLSRLHDEDFAQVAAEMRGVALDGPKRARHLRGDIYELRVDGAGQSFRILFALEGGKGRVLLALEAFSKKTQKTPPHLIVLAQSRLTNWRSRA